MAVQSCRASATTYSPPDTTLLAQFQPSVQVWLPRYGSVRVAEPVVGEEYRYVKFAGCLATADPPLVSFGWFAVVNGGTTRITWPAL